jgi:hypothetical protein
MHACNKKDIYIPDSDHPIPPFIDQIEVNASRNHITASVCVCARARACVCVWGGGVEETSKVPWVLLGLIGSY